jgi:urease accessory protein
MQSMPGSSTISPRGEAMAADVAAGSVAAPLFGETTSLLPLVRLLQLASPALPIGAYSYSQGLEWAVEAKEVRDAETAGVWIGDVLELVIAPGEAALLYRLLAAAGERDWSRFATWNAWFRASRETAELRAETEQTGGSLIKLAAELGRLDAPALKTLAELAPITLPAAYAVAAGAFAAPVDAAVAGYVWSWLENQVLAAIKLVPLGQVAGQRLLVALGEKIPDVVVAAMTIDDADLSTFAPGLCLASARHETQYSRLFRS